MIEPSFSSGDVRVASEHRELVEDETRTRRSFSVDEGEEDVAPFGGFARVQVGFFPRREEAREALVGHRKEVIRRDGGRSLHHGLPYVRAPRRTDW
jgi:hypothetical protein